MLYLDREHDRRPNTYRTSRHRQSAGSRKPLPSLVWPTRWNDSHIFSTATQLIMVDVKSRSIEVDTAFLRVIVIRL